MTSSSAAKAPTVTAALAELMAKHRTMAAMADTMVAMGMANSCRRAPGHFFII